MESLITMVGHVRLKASEQPEGFYPNETNTSANRASTNHQYSAVFCMLNHKNTCQSQRKTVVRK